MVIAKGSLGQTFSHPRDSYQSTPLWAQATFFRGLPANSSPIVTHMLSPLPYPVQHHDSPGKSSVLRENTCVAWGEDKVTKSKPFAMMRGEGRIGTF